MTMKMSPIGFFADLMTSKYFLLFIALISAINIVGYISMGYIDAVMLFAMVAYLTFVFSKNMTVVLLVAVITVNLYMGTMSREGAENQKGGTSGAPMQAGDSVGNLEAMTNKDNAMPDDDNVEMEEPDVETSEVQEEEEEGYEPPPKKKTIKEGITRKTNEGMASEIEPAPKKKGGSTHIDYGTTLSDAYKNLEKMLGEGGLENMTTDTKKLMEQQSKLFNSMENIAPLLAQAQQLMGGMDLTKKEGMSGRVGGSGFADNAAQIN